MKIQDFNCANNSITFKAVASEKEFQRILGHRYNICMFASQAIDELAKTTRTGANPHSTQWLHLPVKLKKQYAPEKYDFNSVKCGCVEFKDSVFFIYKVKKKSK